VLGAYAVLISVLGALQFAIVGVMLFVGLVLSLAKVETVGAMLAGLGGVALIPSVSIFLASASTS
jgi:hypothetical protein